MAPRLFPDYNFPDRHFPDSVVPTTQFPDHTTFPTPNFPDHSYFKQFSRLGLKIFQTYSNLFFQFIIFKVEKCCVTGNRHTTETKWPVGCLFPILFTYFPDV